MMESYCCKLPLKAREEDEDKKQEATASLAVATKISTDAAVAAVLSKLDSTFISKEEQKNSSEGFSQ